MDITCRIEVCDGHVVLALSGDYDPTKRKALAEATGKLVGEQWLDRSKPLRLLIDLRGLAGIPSKASGHFNISNEWWADRNIRLAWLYADPKNDAHFAYLSAVARQHGYSARAFRDESEAVRWLTA